MTWVSMLTRAGRLNAAPMMSSFVSRIHNVELTKDGTHLGHHPDTWDGEHVDFFTATCDTLNLLKQYPIQEGQDYRGTGLSWKLIGPRSSHSPVSHSFKRYYWPMIRLPPLYEWWPLLCPHLKRDRGTATRGHWVVRTHVMGLWPQPSRRQLPSRAGFARVTRSSKDYPGLKRRGTMWGNSKHTGTRIRRVIPPPPNRSHNHFIEQIGTSQQRPSTKRQPGYSYVIHFQPCTGVAVHRLPPQDGRAMTPGREIGCNEHGLIINSDKEMVTRCS